MEGLLKIGSGSRIGCGVVINGESRIGNNVRLYPNCFIENAIIGDNCTILPGCIVRDSQLEANVQIGPYTHLRVNALVKEGAKMGNFVEMKKSVLGKGSKSMHLTYIGDAQVGEKVNIGAGTITCNYDGVNKNKTVLEDGVFIGSGTELVAPVTIRKNAYVGAGSTITEEVPEDSLGVARNKQRNILDWVTRKKKKKSLSS
jgi:bifunctional UDP-N-acetylglucosamine pyrophosphorylase/glucosamine-1-phosphate N-acetyltransferase